MYVHCFLIIRLDKHNKYTIVLFHFEHKIDMYGAELLMAYVRQLDESVCP